MEEEVTGVPNTMTDPQLSSAYWARLAPLPSRPPVLVDWTDDAEEENTGYPLVWEEEEEFVEPRACRLWRYATYFFM